MKQDTKIIDSLKTYLIKKDREKEKPKDKDKLNIIINNMANNNNNNNKSIANIEWKKFIVHI